MKKRVSIYDIAKYLNVSPATVSYAINGVKKVSKETKDKVFEAIDVLGYVPDHNARTLSTGQSHLIGLILPFDDASFSFVQNPFYGEFIGGLEQGILNYDYDVVIGCQKNKSNFKYWATSRGLDGVVMLGKYPESVYDDIKMLNIPTVLIDVYEDYSSEFNNVRIDDCYGMYIATKHLIENGHKKIGFVGSINGSLVDKKRYEGYIKAINEANININNDYIYEAYATFDEGYNIADEIIKNNNVTAIVCVADVIAIGIIKRYSELSKKIPDELSIVGFDDIQDAKYIYPALTTIRQDITQKGKLAAEIILEKIKSNNNEPSLINIEPKLMKRDSTKKI